MGFYYGRKIYTSFYPLVLNWISLKEDGFEFSGKQFDADLMKIRKNSLGGKNVNWSDSTWASDVRRTLRKMNLVVPLGKGVYRIDSISAFYQSNASQKFNTLYPEIKDPNRRKNVQRGREMKGEEGDSLKQLGSGNTKYQLADPDKNVLEVFDNKFPDRNYTVQLIFPEFTSLCPKTGQPDFATIEINYIPGELCIESKSLKLYFFAFRGYGSFMETITNRILEDLVSVCSPRWMEVKGKFNARGAMFINVVAEYKSISDEEDVL